MLDFVRYGDLDPACAMAWAATYGHPPFVVDPESRLGHNLLEKPRWSLTFAVLFVAYGGSKELAARQWTAFSLLWRQGIWNGPRRAGQEMDRSEAESIVWAGLKQGILQAYSDIEDELKPIAAYKWDNLEWVADGLGQVVGYGTRPVYRGVVIDAEGLKSFLRALVGDQPSRVPPGGPDVVDIQPQGHKSRRGRPPGSGEHSIKDKILLQQHERLVAEGMPAGEAYIQVAESANENVQLESTIRRLQRKRK